MVTLLGYLVTILGWYYYFKAPMFAIPVFMVALGIFIGEDIINKYLDYKDRI